jgi:hypothetical protein
MISLFTLFRLPALGIGAFLFTSITCPATLTQVMQEPFIGPGTLTAASPGSNFSSVTGTLNLVRVGPSTASVSAPGWSAAIRTTGAVNVGGTKELAGPASLCGLWGAWYRIKALPTAGGYMTILQLKNRGDTNAVVAFSLDPNGVISTPAFNYGGPTTTFTGPTITPNTWIWLGVAWQIQTGPGFLYNISCLAKPLGGALTTWGSANGLCGLDTSFSSVSIGLETSGTSPMLRVGCPTLFSMASMADATYPSSITPPVEQSYNWYVNPATGNDNNDGSTPATAWQSATKLATESQYCGLLDSNAPGPGGGDVVTIDTSKARLAIGATTLTFNTQGLKVQPVAGQTYIMCQAEDDIANSSFTPTAGLSNTYQTPDTQANIVAWQNNLWMWHVKSASYGASAVINDPHTHNSTSYPTTGAALDAVPGSFYTDGTNLYIHPFNNSNPATDGNAYTRSINRNALAAVSFSAGNFRAIGFNIQKTTMVDSGDNDFGAYCFQDGVLTGTGLSSSIEGGYFAYGDKHCLGSTTGVTNSTLLILDTDCEQGHPYCNFGGQTPFVSYSGSTTADDIHIYRGCTCLARSGLIGSTAGETGDGTTGNGSDILLSHNDGTGTTFASITLDNCNFASGSATIGATASVFVINHTQLGALNTGCVNSTVQETTFPYQVADMEGTPPQQLTIQNSVIKPTFTLSPAPAYFGLEVSGNVTIEGCTIDLSGITGDSPDYFLQGVIQRTGPLNLTFRNNVYLVPSGEDLPLLYNASSTDTLVFDHNAYNLGAGTTIARSFNNPGPTDLTFAAWQAAGLDCINSTLNANLQLQNDIPQTGSLLLNGGADLGSMADVTGTLYAHRDTIGAYQGSAAFHTPQSIASFPPLQNLSTGTTTLPATTDAGATITYTVVSGPAHVSGDTLIITGPGTIVLSATQAGTSSTAPFSELVTITANRPAIDTPTLPSWALWTLGLLLVASALRPPVRRLSE